MVINSLFIDWLYNLCKSSYAKSKDSEMNPLSFTDIFVALIATEHFGFMILEMFLWQTPTGLRIFRQSPEQAATSAALAKNQGLYNGFLASGLLWGLLHPSFYFSYQLKLFFLACVFIAGVFGAFTVSRRIFFVQALPALVVGGLLLQAAFY